jgi:hypothetical protein
MQGHINDLILREPSVTPATLRLEARTLLRCTRDLAALGPPPGLLHQAYQDARHACAKLEHGARCEAAEAGAMAKYGPGSAKLETLDICIGTYVNDGNDLLSVAATEGYVISSGN